MVLTEEDRGCCLECGVNLEPIDDDPNGDRNSTCARCLAEQAHDFDQEPDVRFDRAGRQIDPLQAKLDVCNEVLQSFSNSVIEKRRDGWYVTWPGRGDALISKRWQCRGQDFYPVWSHKWPNGGTACTALSQLIRWLRGQPVLPLSTWQYWSSERVKLIQDRSVIIKLRDAGYPQDVQCVLCENTIVGGMDWWNLNGVSGPCCGMRSGCRQKGKA